MKVFVAPSMGSATRACRLEAFCLITKIMPISMIKVAAADSLLRGNGIADGCMLKMEAVTARGQTNCSGFRSYQYCNLDEITNISVGYEHVPTKSSLRLSRSDGQRDFSPRPTSDPAATR
jgi:hypothetical protein